ncbi:MAG: helix-turn-helix domain-containing protein [Odoribacteraceae bacterium]|jgi:transcriptional regulator with XRE-family HTH domain|nr:helix-turn-helix domain-containing protein [Odoribacteraceae bacterium]
MDIHIRIKELRKSQSLSGKEFSREIGIDNSQYSKIESGKLTPTIQQLMVISSKFNISIDWLLTGKGKVSIAQEDTVNQSIIGNNNVQAGDNSKVDARHYYSDSPDVLKAQIEEKERLLAEKEARIKEKDAQIKEKDAQINKLLSILSNK